MYDLLIYKPIFNALVAIYNTIAFHDFGLAVILITLFIRVILFPLTIKAGKANLKLQAMQPRVKELQEKYTDDKAGLATATMALYSEHKINPLSGCIPILIQLPFLIALYSAFNSAFNPESLNSLYSFVSNPGSINTISLGFIDLTKSSIPLALVAGALQYVQAKLTMGSNSKKDSNDPSAAMSKQMMYIFPIILVVVAYKLPIGIVIYFISSSVFAILEQWYIRRTYSK